MTPAIHYDFGRFLPEISESPLHYWTSLSPFAPVLGVRWRFAEVFAPVAELARDAADASRNLISEAMEPVSGLGDFALGELEEELADVADFVAAEPVTATQSASIDADDLTVLKGIGPKMAERLAAQGVTRFADIAKWDATDVVRYDQLLEGIPGRIERDDWVGQAKALA